MDLVATILPPGGGIRVDHLMHAGDRFLTVPVSLVMWALTAAILAIAVRRTNRELDERTVPLMGVMAAFIFAAQMFNFQVVGGTSGHLLGGVLAGVLLGPWVGTLVMASVVAVQALVFSDGGLVVMGANIFNMGVVGTLGGFALYRGLVALLGGERRARIPAAAIAAYVSFLAGAVTMSLQLIASGTSPAAIVLPTMLGVHAIIGIGEALITAATLGFIASTRPDLLALRTARPDADLAPAALAPGRTARSGRERAIWIGGIAIAVLVVVVLAPLASADPDGLERVAIDLGFIDRSGNVLPGLLGGYEIPGISDPRVSTVLAGLLGVAVVLGAILVVGRLLVRRPAAGAATSDHAHPAGHVHPVRPAAGPGSGGMDRYVEGTSVFHRADARLKFVLAIAAILCISLVPIGSGLAFLIAWLVLVAASASAGLGPFRLSRTAVIAIPFTLAALPLVFTIQEAVLGAVDLGPLHLTISAEGLRRFLTIAVGSWLSVQVALLLAFTTPFHDLIDALRELRLPRILVSIVSFMYRYLAVLTDEGARMLRARDARSVATAPGARGVGGSLRWRASVTGHMVGSLFLRAYERSERIYAAMQARGFEGEFRHLGARAIARGEYAWFGSALGALALYLLAAIVWLPRL